MHCESCHKIYCNGSWKYVFTECQHHTCDLCLMKLLNDQGDDYTCPVCKRDSAITYSRFQHDMTSLLKIYTSSVAKSAEENEKLKSEISTLKQKQTEYEAMQKNLKNEILTLKKEQEISREDHHKCSECEKTDSEQDMQLCATCHELKFEDLEDVKKHALCAPCAIKKHMRKVHQTVDLYPYLSAYNFSSHSSEIESQSDGVKNARVSLNNTISIFNALSINASENYDVLTDMARRSKSTKSQLEFIEKMEAFIHRSKSIHDGADSELQERTKMLQESLVEIKDWYNVRMDNCVDDSETLKLGASADSENNDDV